MGREKVKKNSDMTAPDRTLEQLVAGVEKVSDFPRSLAGNARPGPSLCRHSVLWEQW
jgi:hypothetical protein